MVLGDAFPPGFRRARIVAQLQPGAIVKFTALMDDGRVHEKRWLVLAVDDDTVTFVINSEIGAFLRARPDMLRCQVSIDQASHPFMAHDSQIDCSRPRAYPTRQVVDQLVNHADWVLGMISAAVREEVVAAIKFSPTISVRDAERLCKALEAAELE